MQTSLAWLLFSHIKGLMNRRLALYTLCFISDCLWLQCLLQNTWERFAFFMVAILDDVLVNIVNNTNDA